MFLCKVHSPISLIFSKACEMVKLTCENEGAICIKKGHEEVDIRISPGKIIVVLESGKEKAFYSGSGVARFKNGALGIFSFPIGDDLECLKKLCERYGNYGVNCYYSWND